MYRIGYRKNWLNDLNNSRKIVWILFFLAFADASFLPTPVTTLFLFIVSLNPKKSIEYIVFAISGIVFGGISSYLAGQILRLDNSGNYSEFALFLLNIIPGFIMNSDNAIQSLYSKWDFWLLFFASFTPVPFGLFSFTSGAFHINFLIFISATLISNGFKFAILAIFICKIAERLKRFSQIICETQPTCRSYRLGNYDPGY